MDPETWMARLRTRLDKPFVSHRLRWDAESPATQLREQLDAKFDRVGSDENPEWLVEKNRIRKYHLRPNDGGVTVVHRWPAVARFVMLALVTLAPILVQSPWSIVLYAGVPALLGGGRYTDSPIPACTEIVVEERNGLLGISTVLAIVTTIVFALSIESGWPVVVICGVMLLVVIILTYLGDGVPFVTPDLTKRILRIPFSFLSTVGGSLLLFFPLVLLAVYVHSLGTTLGEYAAGETNRATASVLADMTGGFDTTDPTPAMVRNAVLDVFEPFISLIALVAVIVAGTWVLEAKPTLESLHQYRFETFTSPWQRRAVLGLFLVLNAVLYSGTLVAFGIIGYGITGTYYLPAWTLRPLLGFIPANLRVPPEEALTALYVTLDHTVLSVPGVPVRVLSVGFLLTILWPFVFVGFGTVTQIVGRPYRKLRVLWDSSPATDDRVQESIGADIQVRRIDRDGFPALRPVTLLGYWQFVLVSDVLIEECDPDELEALLRHEEYHLQERSLGLLAVVLSLFVGGQNALAAFYDFRKSEREADKAAADVVGRPTVRRAIIRIYSLRARSSYNPIPGHSPSALAPEPSFERLNAAAASATDPLRRFLITLRTYILAPHYLYFGGVLLETAHLGKRERLKMLRDDE